MTAPNLAQRLVEVNKALGWVKKGEKNKDQGYDYASASSVFDVARDALNKNGVLFLFSPTDQRVTPLPRGDKWTFLVEIAGDYTYINADDPKDVLTGRWVGSATDISDKGTWKALTGSLKNVLIDNHLLPTGDDPEVDGEAEDKPDAKRAPHPVAGARTTPTDAKVGLTEPQRKKLFATFDDNGLTVTESKRYVIKTLVGKESTKQMSSADLDKVLEFFAEKNDATEALVVKAMAAVAK